MLFRSKGGGHLLLSELAEEEQEDDLALDRVQLVEGVVEGDAILDGEREGLQPEGVHRGALGARDAVMLDGGISGQMQIGGRDLLTLPSSVVGRRLGYVGPQAYVFSSSLRDNLLFGVMHQPVVEATYKDDEMAKSAKRRREAELAGNTIDDPRADWVDLKEMGVDYAQGYFISEPEALGSEPGHERNVLSA